MQEEKDGTHVVRGCNASWELKCSLCGVVAKYSEDAGAYEMPRKSPMAMARKDGWVKMWPDSQEAGLPEWRCPECWNYEVQ